MATHQITALSSERSLNDARAEIGLALPPLIRALKNGQPPQEKIDKAKGAIEAWVKLLEAHN